MSKLSGYMVYGTGFVANVGVNTQAPKPLKEIAKSGGEMTVKSTSEPSWLFEAFPEAVADGTLTVVNGSIYVDGIALTDIASLSVAGITLLIVMVKGLFDLKNTIAKNKLNAKEAEVLELTKKKLEEEAAEAAKKAALDAIEQAEQEVLKETK